MLIALTGGIGSGKSTVASRWVALGGTEIDADVLARQVVEPGTAGLAAVVKTFGTEVLNEDSSLNRAQLAKIAFSSEENRTVLQGILHPLIQARAKKLISEIEGLIIYTIPLLVETKSPLTFDRIVTVSAPEAVRIERLINNRGMTEEDSLSRIRAQATDAQREALADTVIDSDCTLVELQSRADNVFASFNI
ncbi:dephospho-CoA kinase [Candidatus Aquiluna sp. IMCC13023]|jgi:dephospho-CoA kinase|uniref:dephospho-CoA kinase n=1 Tax=Candidatus Aquiluna sp. IMCC13023 TaxID=1081644 RepID=UPI00025B18D4|nr:dephospho-CoA kinase [Candidatus Aquiluna sp. IMCC13023]EIC91318.1 dephospho-CoA kinase [Candidatus Aquiluna sp. IMCC13023]|tara:strand:+ start:306 stop:884 length:579 start_codon:yes stop_codon:yes gene_type:complete